MKFELAKWFLRKLCFNILRGLQSKTLAERSRVNLNLWNIFIDIVTLGLTYQVRIITGFICFQKINFFKVFPIEVH